MEEWISGSRKNIVDAKHSSQDRLQFPSFLRYIKISIITKLITTIMDHLTPRKETECIRTYLTYKILWSLFLLSGCYETGTGFILQKWFMSTAVSFLETVQCKKQPLCGVMTTNNKSLVTGNIRGCIQKFPDWPRGARTANGTALCH